MNAFNPTAAATQNILAVDAINTAALLKEYDNKYECACWMTSHSMDFFEGSLNPAQFIRLSGFFNTENTTKNIPSYNTTNGLPKSSKNLSYQGRVVVIALEHEIESIEQEGNSRIVAITPEKFVLMYRHATKYNEFNLLLMFLAFLFKGEMAEEIIGNTE
jgi:hypothetical protein